jgi:hypothetical protein
MDHTSAGVGDGVGDGVWSRVMARIVQGFIHDINNRLVVLVGVRDLLEEPDGVDATLLSLLDREVAGLGDGAALLRRMVADEGEPEVASAGELLGAGRELHAHHRGLDRVSVEWRIPAGLPAVHLPEAAFLRALLLLLAGSATTARAEGAEPAVVADAGVEGGRLVVRIAPGPMGGGYVEAARVASDRCGGRVEVGDGDCRLTVPAFTG